MGKLMIIKKANDELKEDEQHEVLLEKNQILRDVDPIILFLSGMGVGVVIMTAVFMFFL